MGGPVAELDPHAPLLEVLGDQLGQIGLVLDDYDEGLGALPRRLWV